MVCGLSEAENAPPQSALKAKKNIVRGWKSKKTGLECTEQHGQRGYSYNEYPLTVKSVSFLLSKIVF